MRSRRDDSANGATSPTAEVQELPTRNEALEALQERTRELTEVLYHAAKQVPGGFGDIADPVKAVMAFDPEERAGQLLQHLAGQISHIAHESRQKAFDAVANASTQLTHGDCRADVLFMLTLMLPEIEGNPTANAYRIIAETARIDATGHYEKMNIPDLGTDQSRADVTKELRTKVLKELDRQLKTIEASADPDTAQKATQAREIVNHLFTTPEPPRLA